MLYLPEQNLKQRMICSRAIVAALLASSFIASGCEEAPVKACDPSAATSSSACSDGQVCEQVQGSQGMCFAPVQLQGHVFDLLSSTAISDARVVAIDENGAAASSVAVSKVDGSYSLRIPSLRNPDGSVVAANYTLRADAAGYQSFPGGIRPALPLKVMGAPTTTGLVVSSALTELGLIALPNAPRGTIAGSVQATLSRGVLIDGGGATAISDFDGNFVLFNVQPGSVVVRGYAAGVQLNPANVNLVAGGSVDGVVISGSSTPLSTVSGSIQLVNASNVSATSVILVLKDTFNATLERGEVPRGLRVGNIAGAFTIANVPDGDYTVLAAFENDRAVRDPDPNIGGTQIVNITVPGAGGNRAVQLPTSFKVTGALDVRRPGMDQPEAITTTTPTFVWADDSSEDGYQLRVFDAFGALIWSNLTIPKVSGIADVSVPYGGPALTPGMYYQFRASSMKAGAPISRTEDLRGVFFLPKP